MNIEYGGEAYELKKLTLSMSEKLQKANTEKDQVERIRIQHDFLKDAIGAKALADIVGATEVEEADVVAIGRLYVIVCAEYARPITEAQAAVAREQMQAVDIDGVNRMLAAADRLAHSRQAFSLVR